MQEAPIVGSFAGLRVRSKIPSGNAFVIVDPGKMSEIEHHLGLRPDAPEMSESELTDCEPTLTVDFLDAEGSPLARANGFCGTTDDSGAGYLSVRGKYYRLAIDSFSAIRETPPDDAVLANYLDGLNRVVSTRFDDPAPVVIDEPSGIAQLLSAIAPLQRYDANAPISRCVPETTLSLQHSEHGDEPTVLARIYVSCSDSRETSEKSRFVLGDRGGGAVSVDAKAVAALVRGPGK